MNKKNIGYNLMNYRGFEYSIVNLLYTHTEVECSRFLSMEEIIGSLWIIFTIEVI